MSRLEDLVPPLELCRQLKPGKFEDSCFIWCWEDSDDPRAWRFVLYRSSKGEDLEMHQKCVCPAPTLAEILEKLRGITSGMVSVTNRLRGGWCVHGTEFPATDADNPATAALRLFLEAAK